MKDKEKKKNDCGDPSVIRIDKEVLKNYVGKICPKCGREYDAETMFCEEDGTKLIEIWKCRQCGEDLAKAQGYSEINVCPNCGNALDAMQQKTINSIKSGEKHSLKRICTNEKCGALYANNAKFCGKCGSPVVSMQCSCGENFRQRPDGSFDKYCPVCGKLSPMERQPKINAGDILKFGSYPYEEDGTSKPIEWIVLDIDAKGNALLLSKYALDNVEYNETDTDVTWETSTIRHWLNKDFFNKAFNEEEKKKIAETYIENNDNLDYLTKGGNATKDRIFLLSIEEVHKYLRSKEIRKAIPTPYAKTVNGGRLSTDADTGGSCWWWLRSPGIDQYTAADVNTDGYVFSDGHFVYNDYYAVRVAFKINLKNL